MLARAEQLRAEGNEKFKAQAYADASRAYASALVCLKDPGAADSDADAARDAEQKCRLNRAACLLKLQGYDAARREAAAVIALDASNAKAHFRYGQALNHLGELDAAQESLTTSIKLNPSAREPRDALEAIRARLKANAQLPNQLTDLRKVEERALLALNHADAKATRQQMELLLRDARGQGADHWEVRALLGLALLCEEEGETEAASDYLAAARRALGRSAAGADRRAEAYLAHVSAAIALDQGTPDAAAPFIAYGAELAEEMCEPALVARFAAATAAAAALRADWVALEGAAARAVDAAVSCGARHAEACARLNLALAHHKMNRVAEAVEQLKKGALIAQTFAYTHVLCVALTRFAVLQLEKGVAADRVDSALDKLQKAREMATDNGLKRAAVDAEINLHVAQLRFSRAPVGECAAALETARSEARSLGYGAAELRAASALGLSGLGVHVRAMGTPPGPAQSAEFAEKFAEPNADAAEAEIGTALAKWGEEDAAARADLLGGMALCKLLRTDAVSVSEGAVCAASAREAGVEARGGAESPLELTNLAIALALGSGADADAEACSHLEIAARIAREHGDVTEESRAKAVLSVLLERAGDARAACEQLEAVLTLRCALATTPAGAARASATADGGGGVRPPASFARLVAEAEQMREAAAYVDALSVLRRAEAVQLQTLAV